MKATLMPCGMLDGSGHLAVSSAQWYSIRLMIRLCLCALTLPGSLLFAQNRIVDVPTIPTVKFTPPPPPKRVPPMVVKASTATSSPTHKIVIIRGEASTLPDIPPPPVSKPFVSGQEIEPRYLVSIGASVYDHKLSHVTWMNPKTKVSFEAWCGWDFSLLSPFPQIVIGEKTAFFHLSPSHIDTTVVRSLGRKIGIPVHPTVPADEFIISKGDIKDPDAQLLLATLREYYLLNKPRLILIKKAQAEYQAASDAWYAQHPPKPENHTFWLKPHRGSRYLAKEEGK